MNATTSLRFGPGVREGIQICYSDIGSVYLCGTSSPARGRRVTKTPALHHMSTGPTGPLPPPDYTSETSDDSIYTRAVSVKVRGSPKRITDLSKGFYVVHLKTHPHSVCVVSLCDPLTRRPSTTETLRPGVTRGT